MVAHMDKQPPSRWPHPTQQRHMEDFDHKEAEYGSALGRAIQQWSNGLPIPLTLAVELMEQGFDVPALEARHLI